MSHHSSAGRSRPLSPHLSIYRPQISSVLSITHRATGAFLSLGSFFIVAWLWSAAYQPEWFECLSNMAASVVGRLALAAWSFAYFYHLSNGIRHLFWDAGYGYSLPAMTRSGWLVVLSAITLTGLTWLCIFNLLAEGR
jgi:succinate dehydrogenase / fumarate reductase cytochrome b subunit